MVHNTRAITSLVKRMASASFFGRTDLFTKVNSQTTIFKDMESTSGLTVENSQETGYVTRCKVEVSLPGTMAEDIRETIMTTRSMGTESSHGLMADSTTEPGGMANKMASEYITT